MVDFIESNFFLILSNTFILIVSGFTGFYLKRIHIRYTQLTQRLDETKTIFSSICTKIIKEPEEVAYHISLNRKITDVEILVVKSYLRKCKAIKLTKLYDKYKKQEDDKEFNPKAIENILRFH